MPRIRMTIEADCEEILRDNAGGKPIGAVFTFQGTPICYEAPADNGPVTIIRDNGYLPGSIVEVEDVTPATEWTDGDIVARTANPQYVWVRHNGVWKSPSTSATASDSDVDAWLANDETSVHVYRIQVGSLPR